MLGINNILGMCLREERDCGALVEILALCVILFKPVTVTREIHFELVIKIECDCKTQGHTKDNMLCGVRAKTVSCATLTRLYCISTVIKNGLISISKTVLFRIFCQILPHIWTCANVQF